MAIADPMTVTTPVADSSANLYKDAIARAELEIKSYKAHRTALVQRMDVITKKLDGLKDTENRSGAGMPDLDNRMSALEHQIAAIDQDIQHKHASLIAIQSSLGKLPAPTLLADALGNTARDHRQISAAKYLVYRVRSDLDKTEQRKQQLLQQKFQLNKAGNNLNSSIDELKSNRQELHENRKNVEHQFSDLSTKIVSKQDWVLQLKQHLQNIKQEPEQAYFVNHQGKLLDPTTGTIAFRYAEPKAKGLLKWDGIVISAPQDQPIQAVFDGTVVFADELQGLGNVAIVDHGNDYMTLYGFADFLVVETGQQVLIGETIGNVGNSVYSDETGLYFEIRHNASTLDPLDWLALTQVSQ